ncbi:rCG63429 [Rattus norvegicus]|uniref:RCG63429 n=1 Tax=Rattus norvegicus TaxID=10116 RepID=A6HUC0_RAT|nr:rCG63429 [Rattus norvegicus]
MRTHLTLGVSLSLLQQLLLIRRTLLYLCRLKPCEL